MKDIDIIKYRNINIYLIIYYLKYKMIKNCECE